MIAKKIIFSIITIVITIVIISMGFSGAISDLQKYEEEVGIYENSLFDYIVPSPSSAQVETELSAYSCVESVVGFYKVETQLTNENGTTYITNTLYVSDIDGANITMFNEDRALVKGDNLDSNSILIDEQMSAALNLSVGDKVYSTYGNSKVEFVVYGIYPVNTYYDDTSAMVEYNTIIAAEYPNWSYQGAFIDSSDTTKTWSDLYNYIPIGRMKTEDSFSSPSFYDTYYDSFMSANYSSEIVVVANLYSQAEELYGSLYTSANSTMWFCAIGSAAVMVVLGSVFIAMIYKESQKAFATGDVMAKKAVGIYIICVIEAIAIILSTIIIYSAKVRYYGNFELAVPVIACVAVALVINMVVLAILFRSVHKKIQ